MSHKKYILLLIFVVSCFAATAQIPTGYYNDAIGKHGYELKVALAHIIDGHQVVPFSGMEVNYPLTDCDPEQDSLLIDIYGGCRFDVSQTGSNCYADSCFCYDKEHLFCQSWMGGAANSSCPSFSDYHHIFPCDGGINRARGNMYFGEVENPNKRYRMGTKYGPLSFTSRQGNEVPHSGSAFDPMDEYKGDIARALFYVATRYMFEDEGFSTEYAMNERSQLRPWAVEMLLDWHIGDPVSEKEIARNNAIYTIQHNRNPYIDHPELVNMIFGNDTLTNFTDVVMVVNRPHITEFVVNDVNSITITFDCPMVASTITQPQNYTINYGISVGSVTLDSVNQVTLNLETPVTVGQYYRCVIRNAQSQDGVFIADTACFFIHGFSPNHSVFNAWTFDYLSDAQLEVHAALPANYGQLQATAKLYYDGQYGSSNFVYDTNFYYSELRNFVGESGNTIGDPRTTPYAGKCFAVQNRSANGKAFVLKFSTNHYKNIILTLAQQITQAGFHQYAYEWSTDGANYHLIGDTLTLETANYALQNIDLQDIDEIEEQQFVYIRITIDGAYSPIGNARFDNICVHGQKCISENTILFDTIQQGDIYAEHGFYIPSSATQTLGTTQYDRQVEILGHCDSLYTLNLTVVEASGIDEQVFPAFRIFPNPAKEKITVQGSNLQTIELYSQTGQRILQEQAKNPTHCEVSVNHLPAGLYFIKISTTDGKNATQKVVVNK